MEEKSILADYLIVLIKRLKLLVISFFLVSVIAFVYAFFVKEKQFQSKLNFLPPLKENRIASVIQGLNLDLLSGASIAPEQIVEMYNSKALRRSVIDKFNLIEKYKLQQNPNKFENALKRLNEELTVEIGEVGGIGFSSIISFNIAALHSSPDTCYQMVNYAFSLLDSTVKKLSMDLARRERAYIEVQLDKSQQKLDVIQKKFQEFQLKNKAFNVPEQINMALKNYALLRSEVLSNTIKIKTLETDFQGNFYELKRFREANKVLNDKMKHLEKTTKPDIFPGLEISPELYAQYAKHLVDLGTQNQLIAFLKKELEQAKLKEARNVSSLHIIDPSFIPEYKFMPKRIFVMAVIIVPVMMFLMALLLFQEYYFLNLKTSETFIRIVDAFKRNFSKK